MKPMLRLITIALWLASAAALSAQFPLHHTYTVEDGMAMTETLDVAQDPLGYLWVTSTNGRLSRFDGLRWRAYPPDVQFGILVNLPDGEVLAYRQSVAGENKHAILCGDSIRHIKGFPGDVVYGRNTSQDGYYYFSSVDSVFRVNPESLRVDSAFYFSLPTPGYNRTNVNVLPDGNFIASGYLTGKSTKDYYVSGPKAGQPYNNTPYENLIPVGPGLLLGYTPYQAYSTLYDNQQQPLEEVDFSPSLHPNGKLYGLHAIGEQYYFIEYILRAGASPLNQLRLHRWSPENPSTLSLFATINRTSTTGNFWTISSDGSFWATGHNGVRRFLPGTKAFYEGDPEMVTALHALGQLPGGEVLMGGYGSGFTVYRGDTLRRLKEHPWNSTASVMPGSYGDASGKIIFGGDRKNTLIVTASISDVRVYDIFNEFDNKSLAGYHFSEAILPASTPALAGRFPERDSVKVLLYGMVGAQAGPGLPAFGQFAIIDLPLTDPPNYTLIDHAKGIRVRNVLCTAQDRAGRIWFGHPSTGIGVYDPVRDTAVTWVAERVGDPGALSMVIDKHDRLWLGTRAGLYYIDAASSIALHPPPLGDRASGPERGTSHLRSRPKKCRIRAIPDSYVASLLLKNDTLIVGHGGGVSLLNVNTENPAEPLAHTVDLPRYGLGSCEQNALLIDQDGSLWVGADAGAVKIDFSVFGRGRGMQGKVKRAVAGNTGTVVPDPNNQARFPLADRSLNYGYHLPVREQFTDELRGDFLLLNGRNDTLATHANVRSGDLQYYPYLPPGRYQLRQDYYTHNQQIASSLTHIIIPPTLPERWWFFPAIIAALALPLILVLRNRVIRAKARLKQEELLNQLTRAELELSRIRREKDRMQISTLAGTINPHFISNAIEWLQSAYLVKRPIEKMDEMAENLSDVIRMIFTKSFSESPSHSLTEEVQLVERYFRTVNIQYDGAYDFRLPTPEALSSIGHHQVLLMQLQVHAENAVEHGLRFRNKAIKVEISLSDDDDYIYASVEDDGAGVDQVRKKQAELDQRKGIGTKIMKKLQHTFNQYNDRDLITTTYSPTTTDAGGVSFGTRVVIKIPKHYSYDLKSPAG